jgi:hypothetical protein
MLFLLVFFQHAHSPFCESLKSFLLFAAGKKASASLDRPSRQKKGERNDDARAEGMRVSVKATTRGRR